MTDFPAALRIVLDALHATASASPEAELVAHEAFDALRAMGVDVRHSQDGKPRRTRVDRDRKVEQRGLF